MLIYRIVKKMLNWCTDILNMKVLLGYQFITYNVFCLMTMQCNDRALHRDKTRILF
ncbi:hypothetical protein Pint_03712 [Pistacia integerrima]|uniref:Uncharacterized protein n=1 Tax=Pistacia integerrima TaxID=434235 RepID=A0ACC0Z6G5_9ROSI|nr:hypothetical protein Pint_03712 [Pistacia integerrima]